MERKLEVLSPSEWRVLCVVYSIGVPASVSRVAEQLPAWKYRTVQTLLSRATSKGWLNRSGRGRASRFGAVLPRFDAVRTRLEHLLERDFLQDATLAEDLNRAVDALRVGRTDRS